MLTPGGRGTNVVPEGFKRGFAGRQVGSRWGWVWFIGGGWCERQGLRIALGLGGIELDGFGVE